LVNGFQQLAIMGIIRRVTTQMDTLRSITSMDIDKINMEEDIDIEEGPYLDCPVCGSCGEVGC